MHNHIKCGCFHICVYCAYLGGAGRSINAKNDERRHVASRIPITVSVCRFFFSLGIPIMSKSHCLRRHLQTCRCRSRNPKIEAVSRVGRFFRKNCCVECSSNSYCEVTCLPKSITILMRSNECEYICFQTAWLHVVFARAFRARDSYCYCELWPKPDGIVRTCAGMVHSKNPSQDLYTWCKVFWYEHMGSGYFSHMFGGYVCCRLSPVDAQEDYAMPGLSCFKVS